MARNPRDLIEMHPDKMIRIDGHGCENCYNHRKLEHNYTNPHYCKAYEIEGPCENVGGITMVQLLYRLVDNDLNERPTWCPLND